MHRACFLLVQQADGAPREDAAVAAQVLRPLRVGNLVLEGARNVDGGGIERLGDGRHAAREVVVDLLFGLLPCGCHALLEIAREFVDRGELIAQLARALTARLRGAQCRRLDLGDGFARFFRQGIGNGGVAVACDIGGNVAHGFGLFAAQVLDRCLRAFCQRANGLLQLPARLFGEGSGAGGDFGDLRLEPLEQFHRAATFCACGCDMAGQRCAADLGLLQHEAEAVGLIAEARQALVRVGYRSAQRAIGLFAASLQDLEQSHAFVGQSGNSPAVGVERISAGGEPFFKGYQ